MKTKIIVLSLLIITFISCKKERLPEPEREVRYEVKIAGQNQVDIWCDADKTVCPVCAKGQIKYYNNDPGNWVRSNKVDKGGRYYIKVDYNGKYKREYDYQINVYVNGVRVDGIKTAFDQKNNDGTIYFLDSVYQKYKVVELTGTIQ